MIGRYSEQSLFSKGKREYLTETWAQFSFDWIVNLFPIHGESFPCLDDILKRLPIYKKNQIMELKNKPEKAIEIHTNLKNNGR